MARGKRREGAPSKASEKRSERDRDDALKSAIAAIGKKYRASIVMGSDLETMQELRRPFGVPSFDIEVGGGAGAGSAFVFYGPEGTAKTWFALRSFAEAQKNLKSKFKGLVLSLGLPVDKPFSRVHGLRIPFRDKDEVEQFRALYRRYHLIDPSQEECDKAGERVGELYFLTVDWGDPHSLERALEAFVDMISTRAFDIALVDDWGSQAPSDIADANLGKGKDPRRGAYARAMTIFMQKLTKFLQYHHGAFSSTSVILTVQARAAEGGFTLPFGYCLRHNIAAAIRLTMEIKGTKKKGEDDDGRPPGHYIHWQVKKGKYGHGEGARGIVPFNPYLGVDVVSDLARTAVLHGVVEKAGPYFSYGDRRVQGYDELAGMIEEGGKELYDEIWAKLLHTKGLKIRLS